MTEKPPLYNHEGQVINPDKAREAADIEAKYHKKTLGVFRPSREKILKGEKESELAIEKAEEISVDKLPDVVSKEADKIILQILKSEKKALIFEEAYKGNIGGGVSRYRVIGNLEGDTIPVAINTAANIPFSVPVEFDGDEIELIVDVKENIVIQSKLNRQE